ncbi:MAG: metal ABC transporter substrate-binding protein [Acutalibacteraceae bacterium]|nr:metal ABC transporter substrate-binding protein [Acutalibacteraceae bacterium]
MLKKFISLLSTVALLFTLVLIGCNKTENESNGKINVVSTIFPQYDFSRQIAGENANLKMLIPPAGESHTYEPTPQDIISIENSDVFLYIGGENDKWVDDILDGIDTNKTKVIKLMDYVDTVDEEIVEGMQEHIEEHEEEHDETHSKDEHIWTSPINAISMVNAICDAMCNVDEKNSDIYKENADIYISQLKDLDAKFRNVVDNAEHNELVFGDRFPLRYFTDEYSLEYYAAFPGCSSETEPSAATIAFLTDKVKEDKISVILKIELSNGVVANTIAEETNTEVMTFYSCHNLTKEQFENGETYLSMMTENVTTLQKALE